MGKAKKLSFEERQLIEDLRRYNETEGASFAVIAKSLGVSKMTVSNILNQKTSLSADMRGKIAFFLYAETVPKNNGIRGFSGL